MLSLDRQSSLGVSLSCVVGMVWCDMAKLEGGWGLCMPVCITRLQVLSRMWCACIVLYVEKCIKGFV